MDYNSERIILSSDRLQFRQHELADLEAYCAMEMDPEVRRYVGGYPRTRGDAERRVTNALKPVPDRLGMWATILKEDGHYIGRCGVYPHFNSNGGVLGGRWGRSVTICEEYVGERVL